MDWILFLAGIVLVYLGKVEVANIHAEGRSVRAAGFVLTLPAVAGLLLRTAWAAMSGSDTAFYDSGIGFISLLVLLAMVVATGVAYTLLRNATPDDNVIVEKPAPTEQKPEQNPTPLARKPPTVDVWKASTPPANTALRPRRDFPTVMNTMEAARYLNVTERDVLKLIDDGKIAAAKINSRYRISRSVLDEFIEESTGGSSPASEA